MLSKCEISSLYSAIIVINVDLYNKFQWRGVSIVLAVNSSDCEYINTKIRVSQSFIVLLNGKDEALLLLNNNSSSIL